MVAACGAACVAVLAAGALRGGSLTPPPADPGAPPLLPKLLGDAPLLLRTFGVALAVGVGATALALPCAWAMRRLGARW